MAASAGTDRGIARGDAAQTEQRAQALPAADTGRDAAWNKALARLGDRLAALDDCAARAGRAVAAADQTLAQAVADIEQWQNRAAAQYDKSSAT